MNAVIRETEISWRGAEPHTVTVQDALEGRLRITLQHWQTLDSCPSKGAILRELEPFSFGDGPLIHAEYELTDVEPPMAPGQNYRFVTAKLITESHAK